SDRAFAPRAPAATTGLVSSSGLTVSLAAAEGLRRDGSNRAPAELPDVPQAVVRMLRTLFEIRGVLTEAVRMWMENPAPVVAPVDPTEQFDPRAVKPDVSPDPIDQSQAAAVAPAEPVTVLSAPGAEPVVVPAESHPWWLSASEKAAAEPAPAVSAPVAQEPSDAERTAALLSALWMGGLVLQVS